MVIVHDFLAIVFISRVAVDRIEQAHEAAKLEDKKKEEGMR
jgi:hypothetical protein